MQVLQRHTVYAPCNDKANITMTKTCAVTITSHVRVTRHKRVLSQSALKADVTLDMLRRLCTVDRLYVFQDFHADVEVNAFCATTTGDAGDGPCA